MLGVSRRAGLRGGEIKSFKEIRIKGVKKAEHQAKFPRRWPHTSAKKVTQAQLFGEKHVRVGE